MARDIRQFDLIQLNLIGSWGGEGGGIYATGESYTYTAEAFREYFRHLKPQGMLSASAWLSSPPRTFLKLLALSVETLDREGTGDISRSVVAIRSWETGTVIIRKGQFNGEDITRIKDFCKKRGFDLVYFPGMELGDANRYSVLERPVYHQAVEALLSRNTRDQLYEDYLFNIRPPTDDKPYFFHFFRLSALGYLFKTLGREWIPFMEWGTVILWATLLQALIIAPLFIFLPLVFIRGKGRPSFLGKGENLYLF